MGKAEGKDEGMGKGRGKEGERGKEIKEKKGER